MTNLTDDAIALAAATKECHPDSGLRLNLDNIGAGQELVDAGLAVYDVQDASDPPVNATDGVCPDCGTYHHTIDVIRLTPAGIAALDLYNATEG